jgi:hypothetical protein
VGPQVPEGFYEELQAKDDRDRDLIDKKDDASVLMTSYRRPRRQRQAESTLHP